MNNRNLGKFTMNEEIVRENPEQAFQILTLLKFVPMRAECILYEGAVEYIGMSPKFEEVPEGVMVPTYRLVITATKEEGGEEEINSVKVEKI